MTPAPDEPNAPHWVVGGAENFVFHREMSVYEDTFQSADRQVSAYKVPYVDHFHEFDVLANADSEIFLKSLALINR